jgi:hypothetical protein
MYPQGTAYLYPPAMAFLTVPFAVLPHWAMRGGWFVVSVVCLLLMARWSWRLAGGSSLEGDQSADIREHLILWLGAACGFRYLMNCLDHQQTDLLVGALVLGGCLALTRTRFWLAATSLGVAAAIKCTPLLWCPYLVWRGRWRPAVWLLCVAVGVNLLPDLIHPPREQGVWLVRWVSRFIAPMGSQHYYPGEWGSAIIFNQSLSGAGNRLLTTSWEQTPDGPEVVTRPNSPSAVVLKEVVYIAEFLLLLGVLLALGRRRLDTVATDELSQPAAEVLEFSIVLLLMLLLSPMSSKAHFGIMLPPSFCLARLAVRQGHWLLWVLLLAAILASLSSFEVIWGKTIGFYALWSGTLTWSVFLLLLGCAGWLWRMRRAGASL